MFYSIFLQIRGKYKNLNPESNLQLPKSIEKGESELRKSELSLHDRAQDFEEIQRDNKHGEEEVASRCDFEIQTG